MRFREVSIGAVLPLVTKFVIFYFFLEKKFRVAKNEILKEVKILPECPLNSDRAEVKMINSNYIYHF